MGNDSSAGTGSDDEAGSASVVVVVLGKAAISVSRGLLFRKAVMRDGGGDTTSLTSTVSRSVAALSGNVLLVDLVSSAGFCEESKPVEGLTTDVNTEKGEYTTPLGSPSVFEGLVSVLSFCSGDFVLCLSIANGCVCGCLDSEYPMFCMKGKNPLMSDDGVDPPTGGDGSRRRFGVEESRHVPVSEEEGDDGAKSNSIAGSRKSSPLLLESPDIFVVIINHRLHQ